MLNVLINSYYYFFLFPVEYVTREGGLSKERILSFQMIVIYVKLKQISSFHFHSKPVTLSPVGNFFGSLYHKL